MINLSIFNSLPEDNKYIFQTTEVPCTKPVSKSAFLASNPTGNLSLIMSTDSNGDWYEMWSMFNGWNHNAFEQCIHFFTQVINQKFKISKGFIENLKVNGSSPFDGVNQWLSANKKPYRLIQNKKGVMHLTYQSEGGENIKIRVPVITRGVGQVEIRASDQDFIRIRMLKDIENTLVKSLSSKRVSANNFFDESLLHTLKGMPELLG